MRSSLEGKEGVLLKRSVYVGALSAMAVLVFAAIASAQDTAQQSSSDPISTGTGAAPSPAPGQQEAAPSGQPTAAEDAPAVRIGNGAFDPRSEERRVGKECRSRWS